MKTRPHKKSSATGKRSHHSRNSGSVITLESMYHPVSISAKGYGHSMDINDAHKSTKKGSAFGEWRKKWWAEGQKVKYPELGSLLVELRGPPEGRRLGKGTEGDASEMLREGPGTPPFTVGTRTQNKRSEWHECFFWINLAGAEEKKKKKKKKTA